ncbi:MAG: acyl-CoA dehydrogenase family protein [Novosphingobium sp.]
MSILYDEAQQAIAENAARVLAARCDKSRLLALLEQSGRFDESFWQTCIEQGWTAMAIPEENGGLGLGPVELGIVAQACGTATAGAPFLLTNYGLSEALLLAGEPAVQALWLPRLASGEAIGALAFSEGNDPLPHGASAVLYSAGMLSGAKPGVTAGLVAHVALVLAEGESGPVLAVAELEGVTRTPIDGFDNSRCLADLAFAETPATPIAQGAEALAIAREVLARQAVAMAHEQLGGAEALMVMARDYALDRKAFGQPIGAFQSVKHRIAELYTLVELARANCILAASLVGKPGFLKAAASARLSATEAYDTAARDCVQIHGGIGVTWEHGLHLHMRRSRSLAIECGNMFAWEDLLARELTGVEP